MRKFRNLGVLVDNLFRYVLFFLSTQFLSATILLVSLALCGYGMEYYLFITVSFLIGTIFFFGFAKKLFKNEYKEATNILSCFLLRLNLHYAHDGL